jgi:hypothetical protein
VAQGQIGRSSSGHWHYAGKDEVISNEMFDEDAILEFLELGERSNRDNVWGHATHQRRPPPVPSPGVARIPIDG